jgi:hypothetical protein
MPFFGEDKPTRVLLRPLYSLTLARDMRGVHFPGKPPENSKPFPL